MQEMAVNETQGAELSQNVKVVLKAGSFAENKIETVVPAELPWGALKVLSPTMIDPGLRPGEFVAQTLFAEFMIMAQRKLQAVTLEPVEKSLMKSLQRGEDTQFDQLLSALSSVSEHCLPSLIRALFAWYDQQNRQLYNALQLKSHMLATKSDTVKIGTKPDARQDRDYLLEKQGLAVDFIFCQVLIEILRQLPLHPGHEDLMNHIVQLAFKHFKFKDENQLGVTFQNALIVADLFAEVIGALGFSRFGLVRKRFIAELSELRSKDQNAVNGGNQIVSLLMGMKFFRVKMVPIEDFEAYMSFMHDLATFFLDVKDREVKHALAGLFVEILLPVAASVKTEVNVPILKSFVELLYPHTLDQATKKKHSLAFFPLLTCLLCISQKPFFLANWHYFLTMCLSNLKHKDPKMSRVALESLYRLLWVYVIRVKCESNTATHSRLQSIVNSLFPKGSRGVIPRDTPLNIFVKIIHFIAQERLDFAFKEVVFDLLGVGRPVRTIYPERMNIGLRALLVIADSLQQRDGAPPMPRTASILPSGNTLRIKRSYVTKPLTSDVARCIGIDGYYGPCRRAFDGILRSLDLQVGRPMMLTVVQNLGKEPEELMSGDRKPKIDLFRTCIAAIPRIVPDGMSHLDIIELLTRLTVHMDEELRGLACQTMQNMMIECIDWRVDILHGLLQFIVKELHDSFPQLLDSALRMLLQLICGWRNVFQSTSIGRRDSAVSSSDDAFAAVAASNKNVQVSPLLRTNSSAFVLHCVEGLALVMLCQGRPTPRKIAVAILKEIKQLLPLLCADEGFEQPAIDVLDSACIYVLERFVPHVTANDKASWIASGSLDFQFLLDRIPSLETDFNLVNPEVGNEYMQWDPWGSALSGFFEPRFLVNQCPTAVAYAWPAAHMRISAVFGYVDPNNPQNDTRASLLRSSKSKANAGLCGETLNYSNYLSLWQKYLVFACAVAPPASGAVPAVVRCASPETLQACAEMSESSARSSELRIPRVANVSASNLFKLVVPLLRCEMTDMRDSVVLGLGSINAATLDCLMDELNVYLKEAADKKQENVRRRKRRDLLRLQLIRIFEVAAFRGTFGISNVLTEHGSLKQVYLDFIDAARQYLDTEHDRDLQVLHSMRLHFAKLIVLLIQSFPVDKRSFMFSLELRHNLFYLFSPWSGRYSVTAERKQTSSDQLTSLEYYSIAAMASVLCCGPVFDQRAIQEDGYLYKSWLEPLLVSKNEKIELLIEEAVVLLLEFNSEAVLLDWLIDRCYTASAWVADKCFKAIATVFSNREYPCDVVSILALTLLYCGYPVTEVQQLAVELLQILDERFFREEALRCAAVSASEENILRDLKENSGECEQAASEAAPNSFSKSQLFLSQQLAHLHPELTVAIFSEISNRMQTAKPARQVSLLYLLQPWIWNIELVDSLLEQNDNRTGTLSHAAKIAESQALARRPLKGEGWGSRQASEMVLNNLLYLTVKFGNEHSKLLENLWACLVTYWPQNLKIILRYLSIVTTLSPSVILTYSKRVIIYIARVHPERLIDELMIELQTIDVFRSPLERTEIAPFYRWVCRTNQSGRSDDNFEGRHGLIHTKRHTPNDEFLIGDETSACIVNEEFSNLMPSASLASLVTLKADVLNAKFAATESITEHDEVQLRQPKQQQQHKEMPQPFQLPMPAYGGFYSPLDEFLPDSSQSVTIFHRSNIAMLFLTDMIMADVEVDWSVHLPLLLHIAILGMDNSKTLIHDHCKQLLINLIIMQCSGIVPAKEVARVLIAHNLGSQLSLSSKNSDAQSSYHDNRGTVNSLASIWTESLSVNSASSGGVVRRLLPADIILQKDAYSARFDTVNDLAIAITDFLSSKKTQPLWPFEEITAKYWRINSSNQLTCFVTHLNRLMNELLPSARIEARWAQTALHAALSCPNRHYAGRSFQVFRALYVPLTSRMLSDILSRLVETVSEQGEDMQGYVTEIMLTLDAAVVNIEVAEHSVALPETLVALDGFPANQQPQRISVGFPSNGLQGSPTHTRSTSYSVAMMKKASPAFDRKDNTRTFSGGETSPTNGLLFGSANLPRSKSAQALKSLSEAGSADEHVVTLSQLLWIGVSLLESDYEHEFLLALKLLEKLLDLSSQERHECFERLNRMIKQLKWSSFPGVQSLVLKGLTFGSNFETTVQLVSRMVPFLDEIIIDPSQNMGFAMNAISLLPYLVLHYDQPTKLCIAAAENIAERCIAEVDRVGLPAQTAGTSGTLSEHALEHLATVMRLYSRRSFSKEGFQWTKCVVKYLHDTYFGITNQMLSLLSEILDKGPAVIHQPVLQIMFFLFNHVDLSTSSTSIAINSDVLRTVSKHVHGPNWKESAKILKLAVTRTSTLIAPPSSTGFALGSESNDADVGRKELPGRTMEFYMDLQGLSALQNAQSQNDGSPRKQQQSCGDATLKKPWLCQIRVREHLVSLLNASGLRVGLPKSPSVIFSQSSHELCGEPPSSVYSSSGELTIGHEARSSTPSPETQLAAGDDDYESTFPPVFKEFDFLEGEDVGSVSESMDSCFYAWGSLTLPRPRSTSHVEDESNHLGGLQFTGSVPNLLNESRSDSDSSDDEESNGSQLEEEQLEGGSSVSSRDMERLFISQSQASSNDQRDQRPATPASTTLSVGSRHELSTPLPVLLTLECCHHATGQIEEVWAQHTCSITSDNEGSNLAGTTQIFMQLYKEACHKVCSLLRDSCHFLSMADPFHSIVACFLRALDVLMRVADSTFVFATPQMLKVCDLVQRHKFFNMELKEHYETFVERKEHSIRCLNAVKSSIKLQRLGQKMEEHSTQEQEVELCRSLYKLYFQVMLLFESFSKMVQNLESASHHPNVVDMSGEVRTLHRHLLCAVSELGNANEYSSATSEAMSAAQLSSMLISMLQNGEAKEAIMQLRTFRNQSQQNRAEFGCCEEEDVEVLLSLFCRALGETYPTCFIVVPTEPGPSEASHKLLENSLQLSSAIKQLTETFRQQHLDLTGEIVEV